MHSLTQTRPKFTPKFIASVGVLSGISIVLMMILEFPLPFMPPFLQIDFSNIPVLIGAFAFGPVTGLFITLIKDLLHLLITSTGGVGELADFICSAMLVCTASLIYSRKKTRPRAAVGMLCGAVCMAVAGGLVNKFILLPFYGNVMPMEQIFTLCGQINPLIHNTNTYILYGAVPFNFLKAAIICIPTFFIYKKVSKILHNR